MVEPQTFIATYIGSVEQLEILLLLHGFPEKAWEPKEISVQIRSNMESVKARLHGLVNNGLVSKSEDGKFKYAPPTECIDKSVECLRDAYAKKRTGIINMIYTGANKAGPSQSVRDLADAFRINRGEK